jgi:hypothetical protein
MHHSFDVIVGCLTLKMLNELCDQARGLGASKKKTRFTGNLNVDDPLYLTAPHFYRAQMLFLVLLELK